MSGPEDRAFQDGASGGMFTGSTANEYTAFMAGQATRTRASGPPMPPGATIGFLLILFAPVVFTVVGALYPMAGLLMLVSLILIIDLLPGVGGIAIYLVALVWLFMALGFGVMLEAHLEVWRWYRRLRHGARILVIGFIVHGLAFGFFQGFDPATSFFERLSVVHVAIVALGCVGAHFLSRRLDAGLRDRVAGRLPGMAWVLHKFSPRRRANEAALAALEERMSSRKP